MEQFFNTHSLWLFGMGIPIGVFAILFGGTMFLSIPLFQILFPEITMGALVGNIKMGSAIRNLCALHPLRRSVNIRSCVLLLLPLSVGSGIGAFGVASVSQIFIFPALIIAIILAEGASVFSRKLPPPLLILITFLFGIYGGVLGAGMGIITLGLTRTLVPEDERIVEARANTVFLEFFLHAIAVCVFLAQKQLVLSLWLPWSLGSVLGGYLGGKIVHHTGKLSPKSQRWLLRLVFLFALLIAGSRLL